METKQTTSDTYFQTLSQALSQAGKVAQAKDLFVADDDVFSQFGTGGISYNETKRASVALINRKGEYSNKYLQIAIYRMDSGTYELTAYVS